MTFRCDTGFQAQMLNLEAQLAGYRLTYFVDPIFGDDANDGLSWGTPFATPQAAVAQFMVAKADLVTDVGAINATPIDYTGVSQAYGQCGLVLLAAGEYGPADDASPVIEIPSWSAEGDTTGGASGLTIMGIGGGAQMATIEGGATNTVDLIRIAGAKGIRLLNLAFHRGLKTAGTNDISFFDGDDVINETAAAATEHSDHFEVGYCQFLGDVAADGEGSELAIEIRSQWGDVHHCKFGKKSAGVSAGVGIGFAAGDGSPGHIDIHDNFFAPQTEGAVNYDSGADVQNTRIFNNVFNRNAVNIAAGAMVMTTGIAQPSAKAIGFRMMIFDNKFMGDWAALDNTGVNDAIYDVDSTAVVDSGTDYTGIDATNLLST